ncbi:uncharacterized protein LOC126891072 [Diabrotica virgifera virgifera]|uniref:Uncharacterized protein n=1 Tax=Diabrotica virgifera virgifera TaxID=50390 RepID=A0ABM5L190_DIAVI|nr:uncharacterized protein LOC126891072 [Diabrotica virgifera virgifera]
MTRIQSVPYQNRGRGSKRGGPKRQAYQDQRNEDFVKTKTLIRHCSSVTTSTTSGLAVDHFSTVTLDFMNPIDPFTSEVGLVEDVGSSIEPNTTEEKDNQKTDAPQDEIATAIPGSSVTNSGTSGLAVDHFSTVTFDFMNLIDPFTSEAGLVEDVGSSIELNTTEEKFTHIATAIPGSSVTNCGTSGLAVDHFSTVTLEFMNPIDQFTSGVGLVEDVSSSIELNTTEGRLYNNWKQPLSYYLHCDLLVSEIATAIPGSSVETSGTSGLAVDHFRTVTLDFMKYIDQFTSEVGLVEDVGRLYNNWKQPLSYYLHCDLLVSEIPTAIPGSRVATSSTSGLAVDHFSIVTLDFTNPIDQFTSDVGLVEDVGSSIELNTTEEKFTHIPTAIPGSRVATSGTSGLAVDHFSTVTLDFMNPIDQFTSKVGLVEDVGSSIELNTTKKNSHIEIATAIPGSSVTNSGTSGLAVDHFSTVTLDFMNPIDQFTSNVGLVEDVGSSIELNTTKRNSHIEIPTAIPGSRVATSSTSGLAVDHFSTVTLDFMNPIDQFTSEVGLVEDVGSSIELNTTEEKFTHCDLLVSQIPTAISGSRVATSSTSGLAVDHFSTVTLDFMNPIDQFTSKVGLVEDVGSSIELNTTEEKFTHVKIKPGVNDDILKI